MTEMKHTPGPWHLRVSDNGTPHIEHGDCMRYEVGDLISRICVMPAEITMVYNSLNNARLIAAAPDLLAALHNLEVAANSVIYCYDKRPENFAMALESMKADAETARAAAAKATGEGA